MIFRYHKHDCEHVTCYDNIKIKSLMIILKLKKTRFWYEFYALLSVESEHHFFLENLITFELFVLKLFLPNTEGMQSLQKKHSTGSFEHYGLLRHLVNPHSEVLEDTFLLAKQ